jgi:ssRNA-specific RNase YbeY (16S rRNA maturation enzyme)
VGQSKLSGSQSNSRSAAGLSDELVSVRRPPRRSARGVLGMISAIIAFGLIGLGLRVMPAVLAGDLTALAAHPRVVPTVSSTTPPTSPSARPPTSRLTAELSGTPTKKAARKVVVPATGPGTYDAAGERVKSASNAGRLIRFDVKVEDNLDISADAAAKVIAGVLNDQRSWRGSGRWRFELVSGSDQAELHAYIVTPGTTDRLCAPLQTRGEVSCQNGNRIVLNAKRWQLGAKSYGTDLTNYRRYLVNHEFGHYLGYGHVKCPGRGQLAPIMLQQTKGLDGCRKNPWVQSD